MNKLSLTIILLFGICCASYCQNDLIGSWRLVKPYIKNQDFKNKKLQQGDLEIISDSTFHIQGNNTINLNSTIPGWHTGQDVKGTWERKDKTHLTLWLTPKETKLFLAYKIIRLNQ
ncbi:MAG: hypothetical protein QM737_18585 [Ferruginibacter sp.]